MIEGIYQSPNESITCLVNQTTETFIIQIIGRIRLKYYKKAFEAILLSQEIHPYTQIVVNFRDVKLSPDNLRFWFVFNFVKKFYKVNKELKLAIVYGQRSWDKRLIGFWLKLRAIFGSRVVYDFFENIAEAENWMYDIEEKAADFTFFKSSDSEAKVLSPEKNLETEEETFYKLEENQPEDATEDLFNQLDNGTLEYLEEEEETKKEKKSFFSFLKKEKKEQKEKKKTKKERKPIKIQLPKVRVKLRRGEKKEDKS